MQKLPSVPYHYGYIYYYEYYEVSLIFQNPTGPAIGPSIAAAIFVMMSYLMLVPRSARQGNVFSAIRALHRDLPSTILMVIGILTSGFAASRYVFRDSLCV
jgi:hypothetical protein